MMQYEDIKTPEELLKFMDEHISYGGVNSFAQPITGEDDEKFEEFCKTEWRMQEPADIIKNGYGHCFDQVEVEREWFSNHGYVLKTFYIMFVLDYENPYTMHTYLVYEKDNKYCMFEHSDASHKGIYEFDTLKDAVYQQMKWHLKLNDKIKPLTKDVIETLHVYEYGKPDSGLDMYEFIDFVLEEGKEIL